MAGLELGNIGLIVYFNGNEDNEQGELGWGYNYFLKWSAIESFIAGNIGYTYADKLEKPDCDSTNAQPSMDDRYGEVKSASQTYELNNVSQTGFFNEQLPIFPIVINDDLLINYAPGVFSCDPFVCIIPVSPGSFMTFNNVYKDTPENYVPVTKAQLGSFAISPVPTATGQKIYLKDILVNMRFFYESYQKTNTLSELLLELLNGISSACGDFWDFQLMVTENSKIHIVDAKTVSDDAKQEAEIFKYFKLYNKDSVIRNASFSTNVSANIKNSVLLDAFLKYDSSRTTKNPKDYQEIGFRHLYDEKVESLLREDKLRYINAGENLVGDARTKEEEAKVKYENPGDDLRQAFRVLQTAGRNLETVNRAKTALKSYLAWQTKDFSVNPPKPLPHKDFILFPLQLNFAIDGISGLTWGNKVMIDYLPKRYKEKSLFQITNVKHDISINDWITNVETIWRIKQPENIENSNNPSTNSTPISSATDPCWEKINPKTPKDGESWKYGSSRTRIYFPDRAKKSQKLKLKNGSIPLDKLTSVSFDSTILLDPNAAKDFEKMNRAYKSTYGSNLSVAYGYRSFDGQIAQKEVWMEKGQCHMASEPGNSNHGFGLAIDFNQNQFKENDQQHKWMKQNASKYNWKPLWNEYWHWSYTGIPAL